MANVAGAYCALEDMRTGDIAAPSYTTKTQYIQGAAKEIDAALGHLYKTPILIDPTPPENRPSILFLEKLNWLLASGRFMLDVAATSESDNIHAYGKRMLDEAALMMKLLTTEELVLVGAEQVDNGDQNSFTGPVIVNTDQVSLVDAFYERMQR